MSAGDPSELGGKERIGIFYPWSNLGAFPSLRDGIALLVDHGYAVDLFTQISDSYPAHEMDLPGFFLFNRPEACLFFTNNFPWLIWHLNKGRRFWKWLEMKLIRPLKRRSFTKLLLQRHARLPYAYLIGMDPEGLVSAEPLAKILTIPLIYWSLELLFKEELVNSEQSDLKTREIDASRKALITIIQDTLRGKALVDENGLEPSKIFYVPNAPRGKARREKNDYLHQRMNISLKRKVVLCAGSISRGTMAAEIIAAAVDWPEEYILIMQSRSNKIGHLDEYWNKLIKLVDPKKVIISFEPVPQSDFRRFVDSADIGLAFYSPEPLQNSTLPRRNISLMGLSSGKIAGYLHSGLPIIVNNAITGPMDLVESTNCGICVETPEGIKEALSSIFDQYEWYSANACHCFNHDMELERHFVQVIKRIKQKKD